MFDTIYSATVTTSQFLIMAASALVSGFIYAWIMSFRVNSAKRFFIVLTLIPFVVAAIITFVAGNIGTGVAIGGAFALIRFRSAQGSAEEIAAILIAMGAGIAFGLGYIAYGVLILICLALLFILLSSVSVFDRKTVSGDKLLRITIPEDLEYSGTFDDIFARYLKKAESVGVKTTGMGSMFKLSYKICMNDPAEEKQFIDDLRTRNGNLEIAVLPYSEQPNQL
ncbi:MAG: DUF4956 domain-containing protein [Ruminiclostridium sp.]|nr:DUF4956 domain-containing protein [Ruminiclostridium sp.]